MSVLTAPTDAATDVLTVAAQVARDAGFSVLVVVPRRAGVVAVARAMAAQAGVAASLTVAANTVSVRYWPMSPKATPLTSYTT